MRFYYGVNSQTDPLEIGALREVWTYLDKPKDYKDFEEKNHSAVDHKQFPGNPLRNPL